MEGADDEHWRIVQCAAYRQPPGYPARDAPGHDACDACRTHRLVAVDDYIVSRRVHTQGQVIGEYKPKEQSPWTLFSPAQPG